MIEKHRSTSPSATPS